MEELTQVPDAPQGLKETVKGRSHAYCMSNQPILALMFVLVITIFKMFTNFASCVWIKECPVI